MKRFTWLMIVGLVLIGCAPVDRVGAASGSEGSADSGKRETATFAGGCFWCVEAPFEKLDGVESVISGYTGGDLPDPSYEEVGRGGTGHAEAIQVHYDPERISYEELLQVFWRQIDPTDPGGQFVDRGDQYRSEIFYHDDEQKRAAEASKAELESSGRYDSPIVTPVTAFTKFYRAEEYHQDYYKKSPVSYKRYRAGSGRDSYLDRVWGKDRTIMKKRTSEKSSREHGKPSDDELRARLTPLQYEVTQHEGTEAPFRNEYWDNKAEGIYVDVVSGEPLFSSEEKFRSGSGWPSFFRPLEEGNLTFREDHKLGYGRKEVRSKHGDSHLGHVFPDGPEPTGLRYCINSASLRFIPKEQLEQEGYGEYLRLFED